MDAAEPKAAAARKLPANLGRRLRQLLTDRPELSWDQALAAILAGSG
jgi:hypothetical protein